MKKLTAITQFIQEMSFLLDKGVSYNIEDVKSHMENKDVVDWIEKEFPYGTDNGIDFSLFKREDKDFINNEYESMLCGYSGQERRKWGIENNGICLLVSWGIDIMRGITNYNEWC